MVRAFGKIHVPGDSYQDPPRVRADHMLCYRSRERVAHVHERVRQCRPGVGIVGHRQFVFGDEPGVAEPSENRTHADHPEAGHFDRAKGAHAGRAQNDRAGSQGCEDLQR